MNKKEAIIMTAKSHVIKEKISKYIGDKILFYGMQSIDDVLLRLQEAKENGTTEIEWDVNTIYCTAQPLKTELESDSSYQKRVDKEVIRLTKVLDDTEAKERKELVRLQKKYKNKPKKIWRECDCNNECQKLDCAVIKCKQGNKKK